LACILPFQKANHDGLSPSFIKILIFQFQVDSVEDGGVEVIDQIGGQEQDSVKVFQFAKEDSYKAIPFESKLRAFLQKHVGFIQ